MVSPKLNPWLRATAVAGTAIHLCACGIGHDRMLFATNSSVGVDLDAMPATSSIAYSRQNVVIGPEYPDGAVPPVLATTNNGISTNVGLADELLNFDNSQSFVTGDAAVLFSAGVTTGEDLIDPAVYEALAITDRDFSTTELGDSRMRGDFLVADSRYTKGKGSLGFVPALFWHGLVEGLIWQNDLDDKKAHPYAFGTNSTLGLSVAWTTEGAPRSVNLGYKRQETAIVKVAEAPHRVSLEDGSTTDGLKISVPSLLGTFQGSVGAKGTESRFAVGEIFATGRSAELLSASNLGRQNVVGPALFGDKSKDILNASELHLSGDGWVEATRLAIPEPSGIAAVPLSIGGLPLVACIHDEKSQHVHFLQPLPGSASEAVSRAAIAMLPNKNDGEVDDLEFVSFEGNSRYVYAGSSHRVSHENGKDKSNLKVRRLARFSLPDSLDRLLETAEISEANGTLQVLDIYDQLNTYKAANHIEDCKVRYATDTAGGIKPEASYDFEIEGLIALPDRLLFGVKYYGKLNGIDMGPALILEYSWKGDDWKTGRFTGHYLLDFGGQGISELALYKGNVYVSSSPAQNVENWLGTDAAAVRSSLWRLPLSELNPSNHGKVVTAKRIGGAQLDPLLKERRAKLEGVTFTGNGEAWLAFDGMDSGIVRLPESDLKER